VSESPQWEQLPPELTEHIAADTIPIDRATKLLQDRTNTSAVVSATVGSHLIDKSSGKLLGAKK